MPFTSKKQQRWMFANEPAMAKRWAAHTPNMKALPESVTTTEEKKGFHMPPVTSTDLVSRVAMAANVSPRVIGIFAEKIAMSPEQFAQHAVNNPNDYLQFVRVFTGVEKVSREKVAVPFGPLASKLVATIRGLAATRGGRAAGAGGLAAGAGGVGYMAAKGLSGQGGGPVAGAEPPASVPTPAPKPDAVTPPTQTVSDTQPVSRGKLTPVQKGMLGVGALGAGAVGANAIMRRKKSKEVTAAVVEKVAGVYRATLRERFVATCDELHDKMPSEKRASLRVLSEVVRDGKPLGYAMKLAYPHLTEFGRGVLADRLCKYAAAKPYRTVGREETTVKACDAAKTMHAMSKTAGEKRARSFSRA